MYLLGLLNIIFVRIPIIIIIILLFFQKKDYNHRLGILALIFIFSFLNLVLLVDPPQKTSHDDFRDKSACFSNIRIITDAVESYNFDHEKVMNSLDLSLLLEEKNLKELPKKPTNECEYYSEGNLIDDGFIYCKKHGTSDSTSQSRLQKFNEEKTKIDGPFPSFNKPLKEIMDRTLEVFEKITNSLPLGKLLGVLVFYFTIFVLGFTITITNSSYLIFSFITLFILFFKYILMKIKDDKK